MYINMRPVENLTGNLIIRQGTSVSTLPSIVFLSSPKRYQMIRRNLRLTPSPTDNTHK